MKEEKRELPDHIKKEAKRLFLSITSHQYHDHLGNIDREWIEQVIGEDMASRMQVAKAWENNYWDLKKERDEYVESLKLIIQSLQCVKMDTICADIIKIAETPLQKYNSL